MNGPVQGEIPTPVAPGAPVARVRGVPMLELPADLYIPPDALEVFFETFEGPLDLLLYLIRKANLDILDIPMAKLTAQYMEYVEVMRKRNLELAAEYLVMAAMLMEIKSRMLLPRPRAIEAEEKDPRAELVRRLLEYERMKLAALKLDRLPQLGRDFLAVEVWTTQSLSVALPNVRSADLENAWRSILTRARLTQHHRVTRDQLSVREYMSTLLRRLAGGAYFEFAELFDAARGVAMLVVNFLAVLELVRESLIEVSQTEAFAPIYVRLAHAESA
ncbi:MAG: segregation and condensation protein A [Betaproteobacteria bacterium RIFCSPLOWO2_12_FULL_62_13b]|nr:MAG: segregation and condensation protein A [Betaproteobacteria bacterium RIFCSPLOWO2_12_FULL_62_13b]